MSLWKKDIVDKTQNYIMVNCFNEVFIDQNNTPEGLRLLQILQRVNVKYFLGKKQSRLWRWQAFWWENISSIA